MVNSQAIPPNFLIPESYFHLFIPHQEEYELSETYLLILYLPSFMDDQIEVQQGLVT